MFPRLVLLAGIIFVVMALWGRMGDPAKSQGDARPFQNVSQTLEHSPAKQTDKKVSSAIRRKDGKRIYPFRSPSEFAAWLRTEGGYEVTRSPNYVGVRISLSAFRKVGLGDPEGNGFDAASSDLVTRVTHDPYVKFRQTGNTTICDFEVKKELLSDSDVMGYYRKRIQIGAGLENRVDPVIMEGILECLKQEPYCYYLHQNHLRATIEDTLENGIPVFRITEEMIGKTGEILNSRFFIWREKKLPSPYSDYMTTENNE